jgi:hypothetical protein
MRKLEEDHPCIMSVPKGREGEKEEEEEGETDKEGFKERERDKDMERVKKRERERDKNKERDLEVRGLKREIEIKIWTGWKREREREREKKGTKRRKYLGLIKKIEIPRCLLALQNLCEKKIIFLLSEKKQWHVPTTIIISRFLLAIFFPKFIAKFWNIHKVIFFPFPPEKSAKLESTKTITHLNAAKVPSYFNAYHETKLKQNQKCKIFVEVWIRNYIFITQKLRFFKLLL